jgi:predicted MPP superfamily phosphohydrolase
MQISDNYIGNRVNANYLINSLKTVQSYNPDIVVYTGDFISYENHKKYDQSNQIFATCRQGQSQHCWHIRQSRPRSTLASTGGSG